MTTSAVSKPKSMSLRRPQLVDEIEEAGMNARVEGYGEEDGIYCEIRL